MSVAPFPVDEAIARIDQRKQRIKLVGGAAGLLVALKAKPKVVPAVYLTSAEVGGSGNKYSGPVTIQNCDVTLRCILFVQNSRGQEIGAEAAKEMRLVIEELRSILYGWTPNDAFNALSFQAGRDESYEAGWLCNQQVFSTDYRMQQQVMA